MCEVDGETVERWKRTCFSAFKDYQRFFPSVVCKWKDVCFPAMDATTCAHAPSANKSGGASTSCHDGLNSDKNVVHFNPGLEKVSGNSVVVQGARMARRVLSYQANAYNASGSCSCGVLAWRSDTLPT